MSDPWYAPQGLCFTCTGCGNCCRGPETGYVFVEAPEIEALAKRLNLSLDEFGRTYLRQVSKGRISLTEKPNLDCIFWSEAGGCAVYEDRPIQCRTFPFWPEVIESPEAWDEEADHCKGMNHGRRYTPQEMERLANNEGMTPEGPGGPSASE